MNKILNNSYFMMGTKVLTENGNVPIENITVDSKVLDCNNEYQNVIEIQKSNANELLEITMLSGKKIIATKNQFFMVSQKKKGIFTIPQRKMLCKLNKDDYLVNHYEYDGSGHIYYQYDEIKSIKTIENSKDVFNLIVENSHTFVVDNNIVYDNSMMIKA